MIRIFKVLVPASVLILFLIEALLIFGCYAAAFYFDSDGDLFLLGESGWQPVAIAVGLILSGMFFRHLYDDPRIPSALLFLQQLAVVIGITFLAEALVSYWDRDWALPPSILIPGSALVLGAVFLCRALFSLAIRNKVGARRVLFVGLSPSVVQLAGHFSRHPEFGLRPIGYLDQADVKELPDLRVARLGPVAALPDLMDEYRPDWIVVGRPEALQPRWLADFLELRFGGVHAERVASLYETTMGRVCATEIQPASLIFSEILQPNPFNLTLQSFYARAVAMLAVATALPVIALLTILVKASTPGPVLMGERRIGMNGAPFTMYRFRWVGKEGDATTIGKLVRGFGLDAFPQFWNVLCGEMSIVGPDPDRPEFAVRLNQAIPFHLQRTAVKPGMTGWAQIHDSDELNHDAVKRLEYDLYYVKNLSPSLDFSVMLHRLRRALVGGPFRSM